MPHDVFISYTYTANDKAEAEKVCGYLEAEGFSCWIAPRDLLEGDDFGAAIVNAIQGCRVLVMIFSAAANGSRQIARELKLADDANKTVLPIRIENVAASGSFAYFLGAAHWLDAIGGIGEQHLQRLAMGMRRRLGSAGEVRESAVEIEPVRKQRGGTGAKLSPDSKYRTRVNPVDGLTYVFIPPGEFIMGCSPGDGECFNDERPPHAVQITNGFWLCQTLVTQAAWKKVRKNNPSLFKGDQLPVEGVDWAQAVAYCKAIGGRLPTEKEWEYAARAGTTGPRYGAIDAIAWYDVNSGGTTHFVGKKDANAFGIHDMLGNVWEWTADDYGGGEKVVRGGSWNGFSRLVRASYRGMYKPSYRFYSLGFRCVSEFR